MFIVTDLVSLKDKTIVGKPCQSRDFLAWQICLKPLRYSRKYNFAKISEFTEQNRTLLENYIFQATHRWGKRLTHTCYAENRHNT